MFVPPTKINVNINIYKTNDVALVEFLESKEYLPISSFEGECFFIATPELEKLIEEYAQGVEDG